MTETGQLALESLWTLYATGGWLERDFDSVGTHANEYVRAWAIRFLVDDGIIPEQIEAVLRNMAVSERSHAVLAQLACSAKRLPPAEAVALTSPIMDNPLTAEDPQLPLLTWWAWSTAILDKTDTIRFLTRQSKLATLCRASRGFLSGDIPRGGAVFDPVRYREWYGRFARYFEESRPPQANPSCVPQPLQARTTASGKRKLKIAAGGLAK